MSDASMAKHSLTTASQKGLRGLFTDELDRLIQPAVLEETSLPRLLKFSVCVLSVATFCFIAWSAVTPVKELARTQGQVIPSGYNQMVQHLEGGLVREILVREGDYVKQDQVLMRLDGAGTEEDLREQRAIVTGLSLQAERLQATLESRTPDFNKLDADQIQMAEQMRMQATNTEARGRERNVLIEQIEQKKRALAQSQEALRTAEANFEVAQESRAVYEKLQADGLTTRSVLLKKIEEYNTRKGDVAMTAQAMQAAGKELREFNQRHEALQAQQRDTTYTELHDVKTRLAQAREELKKRMARVERLEVRAPVAGYVKGLKVNTIGSVIPAGQTLLELLPADDQLTVEIRIMPQQIGRVEVGQETWVRVDSYDYIRFGAIQGKLEFISATTFTDEALHEDYYKGRVKLAQDHVGAVPGMQKIMPGMTVDADIVTGEKTVFAYLIKPIRNAMHNAFTEQ